ncbi:MAG TPA: CopD family protein, partial [Acidimicrobiia bacterium]|nr:CopD family protein [Acidimicrobiia bacterium]
TSLPDLDDGTYAVTWRVTSADAHPIEGAFTFQVGPDATVSNADGLAARLLAQQGGSAVVGVVYAIGRAVVFGALALLIGGVVFLAAAFREGRGLRRAARVVWTGWGLLALGTIASIGLEGVYAAALPLSKVFDPSVWGDVLDTRFGKVALFRLALLLLAIPLVRILLRADRPLPRWWALPAALVGVALAATPGLGGHASTGEHVGLALVSDTLHVLAMACWIGGLVMLVAIVLVRPLPSGLRIAVNRFSALALGSVTVLVITGGFQAWRQVGSIDALRDTDFGRLLLAKLVVVAAMIVAAAFSREVVNRHFRDPIDDLPGAPASRRATQPAALVTAGGSGTGVGIHDPGDGPDDPGDTPADPDDSPTDESEARHLRRSVMVEVAFAVVVLAITSVLVNTAPARTVSAEPVSLTMRSGSVFADATIAPGAAGRNDIHLTVLSTGGKSVADVQMQLTRPDGDLAAFDVPLRTLGPGHYFAPQYDIPFPGDWRMVLRVRLGATDEVVLTKGFSLR